MTGKNRENYNKNYIAYVNSFAPKTNHFKNCLRAFLVGGLICCIGQFFRFMLEIVFHLSGDELAGSVSVLLIFFGNAAHGSGGIRSHRQKRGRRLDRADHGLCKQRMFARHRV